MKKSPAKKILSLLFCMTLILTFVSAPALADSEGNSLRKILVGIPKDRCPLFYQEEKTGEATGIGVDLMRAAAEESGYDADFRFIEEETLKAALDNPEYDVIMPFGSAIESASGRDSIVSENLMQTPFTVVTVKGRTIPPLNELRVGMLRSLGGGAETVGELYPGIRIEMYDTMDECVKALRAGEVDALLHNSYVWSYILQKPSYGDLEVQPATMFSMDFRAGTLDTPEGQVLINRLNEGIEKIEDTRRQAIILDYTSRQLYQDDFQDFLYRYGLIILLILLLFAAVLVIALQRVRAVRRQQEEKLRHLIDNDPLTGALSMNGFRTKVEELLHAHPDTPYFLAYSNIRDFKFINDSLGREAGDDLLRFWVRKIMETLTEEEAIGRVEVDHIVVLRKIESNDQMSIDDKSVFEPVQNYFVNQGIENRVQTCSGIYVLTPKDFRKIDVDHMIDLARVAEKKVRDSRKGNYALYNPEEWDRGKQIADIINYLPNAFATGGIQVWYQPQVNYKTGEIIGAEALCRWDHAKLGWLQPPGFIATLEEAGLIFDLDSFVWEKVCQDLFKWNEEGYHRSVSVNLSRDDIREDRDISELFYNLIQRYRLSPDQLRIEITETAYVESQELLISMTEKLQAYGFKVEMDDFGSGYSSLHMLKEVPVDRIKLDMQFLTESGDQEKSRIITSCMIQMAQKLGMELIAEGVETIEQAHFLRDHGCVEMQGYYFYKPMPRDSFEEIIKR